MRLNNGHNAVPVEMVGPVRAWIWLPGGSGGVMGDKLESVERLTSGQKGSPEIQGLGKGAGKESKACMSTQGIRRQGGEAGREGGKKDVVRLHLLCFSIDHVNS